MTPSTGVRHFHQELAELRSRLLRMSGSAEELVRIAMEALLDRDPARARHVVEQDHLVDEMELEIDRAAHELLALQQPMARDLRFITMTMKISNDLERVGDHAANIARAVEDLAGMPSFGQGPELEEMARLAREMLSDALDSFVRSDADQARAIGVRDDRVDDLYNSMFRILLTHMMEDPRRIGPSMTLLLVSKNLERIADLATNVAEDVVFLVEGEVIRHGPHPGRNRREGGAEESELDREAAG
ncbi:MAG: phosphate transport system regulatory protein PhoU [Gemmatimonadales bacterium]|nr:MAG: phosphate transport system regulatory protein PhoU [Gemmatimonadales bacterium]